MNARLPRTRNARGGLPACPGLRACLAASLIVGLCSVLAAADDPSPHPLDGTWHWTFTMNDGLKLEPRAKLKQQGDVITGVSIAYPGQEAPLLDGKVNGSTVSWTVIREHNGRKVTTRYQGELVGDRIKGTIETDWAGPGEARRYDWEARRMPITPEGSWRWAIGLVRSAGGGRAPREARGTFKVVGEKVSGKVTAFGRETEIKHGRFVQGEFSFEIVRERDGERLTTYYRGKVHADSIRGDVESDFGRDLRPRLWTATRMEDP